MPDPTRRPGAARAEGFARSLNQRADWARQIREGFRGIGRMYGAWCAVHAVLSASVENGRISRQNGVLSPESVRRFRRFAVATGGIPLDLTDIGGPIVGGEDPRAEILYMLWEIIESRARDRLRVCRACGRWFADEMKSARAVYCSASCKNRSWNRPRRRAAELPATSSIARGRQDSHRRRDQPSLSRR